MKYFIRILFAACLVSLNATAQTSFWQPTNGPYGGRVRALAINSSGHVFAGTDSGVFRSMDEGGSWTHRGLFRVGSLAICSNGHIFASNKIARISAVWRTTDEGLTWTVVLSDSDGVYWPQVYLGSLVTNPQNHVFIGRTSCFGPFANECSASIRRSTDEGQTWTDVNYGDGVIAIDPEGRVFGALADSTDPALEFLGRSTDNGTTWVRADSGLPYIRPGEPTIPTAIAFDSQNHPYAGIGLDRIFFSTNHGDYWSVYDTLPVTGYGIRAMVFTPNDDLFIGTFGAGVYRNGVHVNSGLTTLNVFSLLISPSGFTYARTDSGVFRSVESTVGVEETGGQIPMSFNLEQNYPNPFNPSTVISFQSPVSSSVILKVYNVLGQEVATLVNEEMKLGSHEVTWDPSGMASGVYFCRLIAADITSGRHKQFVETRKLVLLK